MLAMRVNLLLPVISENRGTPNAKITLQTLVYISDKVKVFDWRAIQCITLLDSLCNQSLSVAHIHSLLYTKKNTCTTIISTGMISYGNPSILLTLRELYVVHNNIRF